MSIVSYLGIAVRNLKSNDKDYPDDGRMKQKMKEVCLKQPKPSITPHNTKQALVCSFGGFFYFNAPFFLCICLSCTFLAFSFKHSFHFLFVPFIVLFQLQIKLFLDSTVLRV